MGSHGEGVGASPCVEFDETFLVVYQIFRTCCPSCDQLVKGYSLPAIKSLPSFATHILRAAND